MQLYLLRHGDAVEARTDDASRPLSVVGEEQIQLVARALKRLGASIDCIFASPLTRAQQTASIVQQELGVRNLLTTENLVPSSNHRQIIRQLGEGSYRSVLLAGHEPHLSGLISFLVSDSHHSHVEMKKGALALVDLPLPVSPGRSSLRWLVTPDFLSSLLVR